jgi:hypothetical protein
MEPVRTPTPAENPPRKPWRQPVLQTLPKLTELTLQSGGIIPGGGTGGGGGIF